MDMAQTDRATLEAALLGYQARLAEIEAAMEAIQRRLVGGVLLSEPRARRKPRMSKSARKRIAAAQKKRWAEYRKTNGNKLVKPRQ